MKTFNLVFILVFLSSVSAFSQQRKIVESENNRMAFHLGYIINTPNGAYMTFDSANYEWPTEAKCDKNLVGTAYQYGRKLLMCLPTIPSQEQIDDYNKKVQNPAFVAAQKKIFPKRKLLYGTL